MKMHVHVCSATLFTIRHVFYKFLAHRLGSPHNKPIRKKWVLKKEVRNGQTNEPLDRSSPNSTSSEDAGSSTSVKRATDQIDLTHTERS